MARVHVPTRVVAAWIVHAWVQERRAAARLLRGACVMALGVLLGARVVAAAAVEAREVGGCPAARVLFAAAAVTCIRAVRALVVAAGRVLRTRQNLRGPAAGFLLWTRRVTVGGACGARVRAAGVLQRTQSSRSVGRTLRAREGSVAAW